MTESDLRRELRGLVEKWGETAQKVRALADRCANVRDSVGLWSEANTLDACADELEAALAEIPVQMDSPVTYHIPKGEAWEKARREGDEAYEIMVTGATARRIAVLQRALELACLQFVGDDDIAVLSFIRKAEAEVLGGALAIGDGRNKSK